MWRCNNCHSTAVQGVAWVDLNTNEYVDNVEAFDEHWCESCGVLTSVYYKDEPIENEILQDDEDDEDQEFYAPI